MYVINDKDKLVMSPIYTIVRVLRIPVFLCQTKRSLEPGMDIKLLVLKFRAIYPEQACKDYESTCLFHFSVQVEKTKITGPESSLLKKEPRTTRLPKCFPSFAY